MRRALVLAVLAAPTAAWAGHHCHEVSQIVGYEQCGRFGGWSFGAMVSLEAGVSALRFSDTSATGGRTRLAVGFGRTFYLASQLDLAAITGGVRPGVAALGGSTMPPTAAGGSVAQELMLLGAHRRFGQLTIAAEAGPGVRFATYDTGRPAMQGWFVLELQPKLDLWLTPNISVGAVGGFDLVQHDGFSAALVMGFHLTPYDMAR
jgi:hypothetical protein